MEDCTSDPLYCHVCGEPLLRGVLGHSGYEYSCRTCLAAYHVEAALATYVTPSFVGHGEPPAVLPLAQLREPHTVHQGSAP